jgi:thioredoxin 1
MIQGGKLMAIIQANDSNFMDEISNGVVLADFWAMWCGPCRMLAPILEETDSDLSGKLKIVKLNVDDNPVTQSKFGVMGIPAMLLFKDGEIVDKIVGFQTKEYLIEAVSHHMD